MGFLFKIVSIMVLSGVLMTISGHLNQEYELLTIIGTWLCAIGVLILFLMTAFMIICWDD